MEKVTKQEMLNAYALFLYYTDCDRTLERPKEDEIALMQKCLRNKDGSTYRHLMEKIQKYNMNRQQNAVLLAEHLRYHIPKSHRPVEVHEAIIEQYIRKEDKKYCLRRLASINGNEERLARNKKRYAEDEEYRQKMIARADKYRIDRYAEDEEYRERVKAKENEKYATDEKYRERKINNAKAYRRKKRAQRSEQ